MRGADHVMQTLAADGVRHIFALSGNQIMPLFDASLDAGIRLFHTRHEAAAVYMAEGYAQLTGGVGVALVTAGAGLGNALAPLLTARASDTPVLLLSGDSPVASDGKGAFQEMDQVALTRSLTKWSTRPETAADLSETIQEAMYIARTGRPGPVHVSLPADLLTAKLDAVRSEILPDIAAVDYLALADWLDKAERPLIVFGPSLTQTRAPGLAQRLEAATGAPVVAMESPRGLNDPALGQLAWVFAQADHVLLLGKPLDFTLRFGAASPQAHWAIVHDEAEECARAERNLGEQVQIALVQSAKATAEALCGHTSAMKRNAWREEVTLATAKRTSVLQQDGLIQSPDLCAAVQEVLRHLANPILVCDGGEFGQWAQAGVMARRRVINGVSGAIGGGVCYAMAARAADPSAQVIALMGDGTVGFHLAEFETAVREDLPFVAVVGNDLSWNAEHQIQLREFGADRLHGCGLTDARYDEAVIAMGGFGAYVTDLEALPDALNAAFASGKPACVNVQIKGLPAPVVS
jgi:acetolactate synthase I/II/III large subunit